MNQFWLFPGSLFSGDDVKENVIMELPQCKAPGALLNECSDCRGCPSCAPVKYDPGMGILEMIPFRSSKRRGMLSFINDMLYMLS